MMSAMAPPARTEHALTSSRVNPTCGPVMATAACRALVISVICTYVNLFLWNTLAKGVWLVTLWC